MEGAIQIPAYAGMTGQGAGYDVMRGGYVDGGIPAYAGMTGWEVGTSAALLI